MFISVLQLGSIVTFLQCVAIGVIVQCCNMASTDSVFALERCVWPWKPRIPEREVNKHVWIQNTILISCCCLTICVSMVHLTPCSVTIDPVPGVNCNSWSDLFKQENEPVNTITSENIHFHRKVKASKCRKIRGRVALAVSPWLQKHQCPFCYF